MLHNRRNKDLYSEPPPYWKAIPHGQIQAGDGVYLEGYIKRSATSHHI